MLVGDRVAIEMKGKPRITTRDYKGLRALAEEVALDRRLVVCRDPRRHRDDEGVEIVLVDAFLRDLWDGKVTG